MVVRGLWFKLDALSVCIDVAVAGAGDGQQANGLTARQANCYGLPGNRAWSRP